MPKIKNDSLRVQKPFPVLKLPAEIRNHIWRYIVVKDGEVVYRNHMRHLQSPASRLRSGNLMKSHQEDDERRLSSQLAVAFTCRQLYLEVTPIYYGENVFHPGKLGCITKYCQAIEGFAEAIGPENASTITEVCLYESWFLVGKYLSLLPGLKCLHFKKSGNVEWYKKMTWWAQKRASLIIVHDGEVWGPEKWDLYPGECWNTTSAVAG